MQKTRKNTLILALLLFGLTASLTYVLPALYYMGRGLPPGAANLTAHFPATSFLVYELHRTPKNKLDPWIYREGQWAFVPEGLPAESLHGAVTLRGDLPTNAFRYGLTVVLAGLILSLGLYVLDDPEEGIGRTGWRYALAASGFVLVLAALIAYTQGPAGWSSEARAFWWQHASQPTPILETVKTEALLNLRPPPRPPWFPREPTASGLPSTPATPRPS